MSKCVCYRQIVCKLFHTASLFPYNKCERTQRVLNEWLALAQACINFGRVRMMIQGLFTTLTEICAMDHNWSCWSECKSVAMSYHLSAHAVIPCSSNAATSLVVVGRLRTLNTVFILKLLKSRNSGR